MDIEHHNNSKTGYFRIVEESIEAGRMTYVWAGESKIIIDHTDVNPAFRGKDVGKKLLTEVVNFARGKHITVIPLCPFAKAMFGKHEGINDVLA